MFKIIFVLIVAGTQMGTVGTMDEPMDQAACVKVISDPDHIAFVHDRVFEVTGQDVEVEGRCVPVVD